MIAELRLVLGVAMLVACGRVHVDRVLDVVAASTAAFTGTGGDCLGAPIYCLEP